MLLCLLASLSAAPAVAQTYPHRDYRAEAGVASALAVAYAGDGSLLVGTNDGLLRFDGWEFESVEGFGDVRPRVGRLATGPDGTVWGLAEPRGPFRVDPDARRATMVETPPALRRDLRLDRFYRRLRPGPSGGVWINDTRGALWHYDPARDRWRSLRVREGEPVVDFFFEPDGDLWLASGRRVGRAARDGDPTTPDWIVGFEEVVFLAPLSGTGAWAGTRDGLYQIDSDGAVHTAMAGGFQAWWHARPAVDQSGRLLLVAGRLPHGDLGVFRVGPDGRIEFPESRRPALRQYTPRQLLFDPEGGFWLAHQEGLVHVEREDLVSFPIPTSDERLVWVKNLIEDPRSGRLWVSTWGGMYRFGDGRLERVSGATHRATGKAVPSRDGSVWWTEHEKERFAAAPDGAARRVGDGFHLLFEAPDGTRLETRPDGLYRVDGTGRTRISRRSPWVLPAAVGAGGRLWLSFDERGIDTLEGDSLGGECAACLSASMRRVIEELRDVPVIDIEADPRGRVWLTGGDRGLFCLFQEDGRWRARRFGEDDGLLTDRVLALDATPDGRLWVGTTRGLQGFRTGPAGPRLEPFLELRGRDGLEGEWVDAVVEDARGHLWFASTAGKLHRLDYRRIPTLSSPAVRIDRIRIDGEDHPAANGPIAVESGRGHLEVEIAGLTHRQTGRVRFEVRLAPREKAWTDLGHARVARYAYLSPGRYTIEVRAVREGREPGPVVRRAIVASPVFYGTWWFRALVLAALLLPAFLWYRSRMARRLALERLRLRIATDLHDDLGSGLAQVSLYGELIRRASSGRVAEWADRVGAEARSLDGTVRDIIWAIHPEREDWESLEMRMKSHATELLAPREIALDMRGAWDDGGEPSTRLPIDVRRNVLLVFKEALHNVVRHADPDRVRVRWRLDTRRLALSIEDDGRGFDRREPIEGEGLSNMRRRAEEIGAELELDTTPGEGTRVRLEVPLDRSRANPGRPHMNL